MDPSTWSQLRPILEQAVGLAKGEREAFVRSSCAGDEDLAERALAYLRAEEDPRGILVDDTPIGARAAAAARLPVPGARLGAWRLERELGRGGMGSVWLASRADETFEKYAALKLIPSHLGGDEILARFRREQQLLASLEHPGIARLIDAGKDETGRPFLVMEYVEGRPIDAWCDERGLSVRARLELFRGVCAAVEHAHRKLVVHRDLKPANILVGKDGQPKLLDFGIARMLEGDPDLTRTGETRFTPHYASPEQVRGEVVGTQSDVYALGVVLYELLTGERPHRFETGAPTEILRVLSEADPRPPSAVAKGAERGLEGDLDAIVLCALRREPERRYGSVETLAADVGRYLAGLPVQAQPDTVGYRTRRFLRRHGVSVGVAAALLVALVAGLIGTTYQYLRAQDARAAEAELTQLALTRADELERLTEELERESAEADRHFADVRRFSTDLIFDVARTIQREGATRARERLVTLGLEHLDRLAAQAGDDELRVELAAAYLQMGDVLGARIGLHLGRTSEAVVAYRRALELVNGTANASERRYEQKPLAATAGRKLADALMALGRPDEARIALEDALALLEDPGANPSVQDADLVLAAALISGLRVLETQAGRLAAAELLLEDELELTGLLLERHPRSPAALETRAMALLNASNLSEAKRERERSLRYIEEACLLLEEALAGPPGNVALRRSLCSARVSLGETLALTGEQGEARWVLEETVEWLEEMVTADPDDQQLQRDLAVALMHLAKVQFELHADATSLDTSARSLELAETAAALEPANVDLHSIAAMAGIYKARALIRLERPKEARAELEQSAARSEQILVRAPGDSQRRRAFMVNCLEIGQTALRLGSGGLRRGRDSVDRGLALLADARAGGLSTPVDEQIESRLRATSDELDARLAAADAD